MTTFRADLGALNHPPRAYEGLFLPSLPVTEVEGPTQDGA